MVRLVFTKHKPWGKYTDLMAEQGKWHMKVIKVNKGCKLSLQTHKLRSEMWIVLEGKIKAVIGNTSKTLSPKKTAFIKVKEVHRMIALEDSVVAEVTFGTHHEKDIVRLEDEYGRTSS